MAYYGNKDSESIFKRIQPRIILLAGWLIICLGVLAYIANGAPWLMPDTKAVATEMPAVNVSTSTAKVLVPIQPIQAGQKLTGDLFRIEDRPISGIESKVIRTAAEVDGGYAASMIAADAPLLKDYVSYTSQSNAVVAKIPDGFRGVTISVNEESAVEGWVRPGARVDVIMTTQLRGRPMVTTIVENARVLSAEHSTAELAMGKEGRSDTAPMPSHVTLLVTLRDAQRIQVAKASGTLGLNLRGTTDESEVGNGSLTADRLLRPDSENDAKVESSNWIQIQGKHFRVDSSGKLVPGSKPADLDVLSAAGIPPEQSPLKIIDKQADPLPVNKVYPAKPRTDNSYAKNQLAAEPRTNSSKPPMVPVQTGFFHKK
jgi:pilus assembly protein CpaB